MADEAAEFRKKAQETGESFRRFLIGINTGGISLTVALAGTLAGQKVAPAWAIFPASIFVLGLTFTGLSYRYAKARWIGRQEAAEAGEPLPEYNRFPWRSEYWELASLGAFVVAAISALVALWHVRV